MAEVTPSPFRPHLLPTPTPHAGRVHPARRLSLEPAASSGSAAGAAAASRLRDTSRAPKELRAHEKEDAQGGRGHGKSGGGGVLGGGGGAFVK